MLPMPKVGIGCQSLRESYKAQLHSTMTLSITTISVMTLSIMTLSITTLSIMTLSIKGLFVTLTTSDTQQK